MSKSDIYEAFRLGRMSPIEAVEALKTIGYDFADAESLVDEWIWIDDLEDEF